VDHFEAVAAQRRAVRRAVADRCEELTAEQWRAQSLCGEWSVHDVLAHLVVVVTVPLRQVAAEMLRARGNFHRANVALTRRAAAAAPAELIGLLRANADSHFTPPGLDSTAPLTDSYVHALDMFFPLGLPAPGALGQWPFILDFLSSPKARRGFVGRELPAVALIATDVAWSSGRGPEVRAPAAALGLALTRRRARLDEAVGPGSDELRRWVG
jgi:uncharacterized protein (TIGR03083 family)